MINGMRNKNAALDSSTVRVAIPEGYTVKQVIALLAEALRVHDALEEYYIAALDRDFLDDKAAELIERIKQKGRQYFPVQMLSDFMIHTVSRSILQLRCPRMKV